jgi:hypothetical protein
VDLLLAASVLNLDKFSVFEPQYSPVTFTPEDVTDAKSFWSHFEIPMSKEAAKAFATIEREGIVTPKSQHDLKVALIKEIAFNNHDAFRDEMISEMRKECRKLASRFI